MEFIKHDFESVMCPVSKRSRKFRTCKREHCIQLEECIPNGAFRCRIIAEVA